MGFSWRSPFIIAAMTLALVGGSCSSDSDDAASNPTGGDSQQDSQSVDALPGDELRLNEVQMLGSHNSYHLPGVPEVSSALQGLVPDLWDEISYAHQPLADQLEQYGIRQFELDVYVDSEGGTYANPGAYQLVDLPPLEDPAMSEPGFKVLHIADVDTNTTCVTFVACLTEIETWSTANPDHLPIMVMVETKGDDLRSGASDLGVDIDSLGVEFAHPPEMTAELFDELEAEVRSVFGEDSIITPDDVRGEADTLEEAILSTGWPTIGDSRGKVLFSLVDTGAARDLYVEDAPSLAGKLFFTSSEPGRPDAAFVRVDNSLDSEADLDAVAEAGYLIRTRTDEPGVHAFAGDTTLADSALASGGQYLSTDYYVAEPNTGYVVALPDGVVARCNPVTAPVECDVVTEG